MATESAFVDFKEPLQNHESKVTKLNFFSFTFLFLGLFLELLKLKLSKEITTTGQKEKKILLYKITLERCYECVCGFCSKII